MTCQHCQTWNGEEDHRCRRCGRRLSSRSSRISPDTYPIAATGRAQIIETATAPALNMTPAPERRSDPEQIREQTVSGQPLLFDIPADSRVVSVDSMRTPMEREAIRARAADLSRPAIPRVERAEVSPRQNRRGQAARQPKPAGDSQQRFDFAHQQVTKPAPTATQAIVCDAPVAPVGMRIHASAIDGLMVVAGCVAAFAPVWYFAGALTFDKYTVILFAVLFAVVTLSYRLMWVIAGKDSLGMQMARIRLVDFDGNRPRVAARYQRFLGGLVSALPAGLGLLWTFVDEDGLMWHDHISSTFPSMAD